MDVLLWLAPECHMIQLHWIKHKTWVNYTPVRTLGHCFISVYNKNAGLPCRRHSILEFTVAQSVSTRYSVDSVFSVTKPVHFFVCVHVQLMCGVISVSPPSIIRWYSVVVWVHGGVGAACAGPLAEGWRDDVAVLCLSEPRSLSGPCWLQPQDGILGKSLRPGLQLSAVRKCQSLCVWPPWHTTL